MLQLDVSELYFWVEIHLARPPGYNRPAFISSLERPTARPVQYKATYLRDNIGCNSKGGQREISVSC